MGEGAPYPKKSGDVRAICPHPKWRFNVMVITIKRFKKAQIALNGTPMILLRDITCHMGSHSVTCHPTQVYALALTPVLGPQAGTRFTYPGGMEG